MREEDIKYIHELEERVQELEEDKKALGKLIDKTARISWDIEQQNKRYREAIMSALQAQKEHGLSAGLVIKSMTQELEEVLECKE